MTSAAVGTKVVIDTLDGKQEVEIKEGTQSGSTVVDSGSLQPSFLTSGSLNTGSAQWKGYFLPSTTETYTFFGFSDAGSLIKVKYFSNWLALIYCIKLGRSKTLNKLTVA